MSAIHDIKRVIDREAAALQRLTNQIGDHFEKAINLMDQCPGKVIVSGVGKSGHIGRKMAASFSSTGTSSFFMHATEGVHGDLGMVEANDVIILISNSGETGEVLNLLPSLTKIGVPKIAITSNGNSTLANACDVALVYKYEMEADHLGLAPTTSATLTLVIGDALAIALSMRNGFTENDFHLYHPGGSLGKKLSENTGEDHTA